MKLKLDENIPQSAATRLAALGYDVDTVLDEQLGGRSDEDVWAAAQAEDRFLVTHDLDFSDTRKFEPGNTQACSLCVCLTRSSGASAITSSAGSRTLTRIPGSAAWWLRRCARCASSAARLRNANAHKRKPRSQLSLTPRYRF